MITRDTITSKQRSKLKSIAATMQPIGQIGKGGVTDNLLKMLSAIIVALFLAFPHLKNKYFKKYFNRRKGGNKNA